jgi:hypothetical protein
MARKAWEAIKAHPLVAAISLVAIAVAGVIVATMEILEGMSTSECLTCRPTTQADQTLEYVALVAIVMLVLLFFLTFLFSHPHGENSEWK